MSLEEEIDIFELNDRVARKDRPEIRGIVEGTRIRENRRECLVFWFDSQKSTFVPDGDLRLAISPRHRDDENSLFSGDIADHSAFLRFMTFQRIRPDHPLSDQLLAFNASRTRFFPYQFKPLMKFLDSERQRVLICDEVGLGKTIESGLILTEIMARETLERVLIVCPPALREKWQQEMKNRFAFAFEIVETSALKQFISHYTEATEKGDSPLFGIVSYHAIRNDPIRESLKGINFDLVIFDEAHHMRNPSTKQHKAGEILCDGADRVVMLTATPVQTALKNLSSLLLLLLPDEFQDERVMEERLRVNEKIVLAQNCLGKIPPDFESAYHHLCAVKNLPWFANNPWFEESLESLDVPPSVPSREYPDTSHVLRAQKLLSRLNLIGHVYTRTKKRDVLENRVERKPASLKVNFTHQEREVYEKIIVLLRVQLEKNGRHPLIVRLLLNNIERRLCSCLPAALEYFQDAVNSKLTHGYHGYTENLWGSVIPDSFDEENTEEFRDPNGEADLKAASNSFADFIDDLAREPWGRRLDRSEAAHFDSKFKELLNFIRRMEKEERRPVKTVIFASFRKTLDYLARTLEQNGYSVRSIHGGIPIGERPGIIKEFRERDDVNILLSSRVGGEGLDFQFAHVLVNYDLPWNPMEVEQRIGRLDRIGQESPAIYVCHLWIANTVEERILNRLYERVGLFEGTIGELEPILGEVVECLENVVCSSICFPEKEEFETRRLERVLEERKDSLRDIDRESAQFIGTDAFFAEEAKRIWNDGQYVSGDQLRLFFEDFLKRHSPSSHWQYSNESKQGIFQPSEDFVLKMMRRMNSEKQKVYRHFLSRQSYKITFDAEVAYARPEIEFINILHPLPLSISDFYSNLWKGGEEAFPRAFHILLKNEAWRDLDILEGFYVFRLGRIEISGARPCSRLEFTVADGEGNLLDPGVEKVLMSRVLSKGSNPICPLPDFCREDETGQTLEHCLELLEETLFNRRDALKEEMCKNNIAFVQRQIHALETAFERQERTLKEQIDRWRREKRPELQRLPEGKLRKLEINYKEKVETLRDKTVTAELETLCCGILELE